MPPSEPRQAHSSGGSDSRRFVTIRDVAADAGVGIATVSRALNNRGYVATEVRSRVIESAARLGYRPSERARSMRRMRSMSLGVLVPELVNPVYLEFLRGVEEVAQRHGYVTVIGNSCQDPEREAAILDRLVAERTDGIVVAGMSGGTRALRAVADRGIPVVPPPGSASRRLDEAWEAAEARATEDMARRLVDLGHRRVALVGANQPPGVETPSRYRRSRNGVIRRVLSAIGAEVVPVTLDRAELLPSAARAVGELGGRRDQPTAYISTTHLAASAVLYGLSAAGLAIPGDVSFVTYGDSDWAAAYRPALSVISHDIHAEAVQLTEMLLARIDGRAGMDPVRYEARFVERASCGPARLSSG